jgi:hypothetical protein
VARQLATSGRAGGGGALRGEGDPGRRPEKAWCGAELGRGGPGGRHIEVAGRRRVEPGGARRRRLGGASRQPGDGQAEEAKTTVLVPAAVQK